MALLRVEAEDMMLEGYTPETFDSTNLFPASGGELISTPDTGTARTTFTGSAGLYDIVIRYLDQSSGSATAEVVIGGNSVDNWTFNAGSDGYVERTVATGIQLEPGTPIRLTGTSDSLDLAQIDYLEFVPLTPQADLLAPNLKPIAGGDDVYAFSVSYTDDLGIDISTLDSTDIFVTRPNGIQQAASLIRAYTDEAGNLRKATYAIAPDGGIWDATDVGEYTVAIAANQVLDLDGNAVEADELGSFTLALNDAPFGNEGNRFPDDAGVVDVRDYGAIPNDGIDDTAAIQQAFNENAGVNKIFYFANGVYDVSDRLDFPAGNEQRNIIQGQSREGAIIKLADDSGLNGPVISTIPPGDTVAQRFRNSIRDLTIDVGSGNPDAIGTNFMANNQGTVSNVDIVSRDGQGAIGLNLAPDENGPLLVQDVRVVGFDVGILTFNPTASQTLENITLEDQNQLGWRNFNQTVFVRDLESNNTVTVIENQRDGSSELTLIDANLTGVGAAAALPAIRNEENAYVRNLNTSGYDLAVFQDGGNPSQPDGFVEEWIARGEFTTLFESPQTSLNLEVLETPEVPWDDPSTWVSPLEFGGLPNDDIDDTAAIQAAIDSGATTVYLPNGVWTLNGTVELRGDVQRFIATEADVVERGDGDGIIKLVDGTQPTVVVERFETEGITFVQDSTRTLVMSSLIIDEYYNTPTGTGDLFVEDVSGGPWTFTNQNVWARQINPETVSNPRIKNDGGNLWILGYKTEDEGTLVETVNGGRTEVLGAYLLRGSFGDIPAFINNESSVSVVNATFLEFSGGGGSVPIGFQETRNGVTRTTVGLPGYYSGIANSDPVAMDDTATTRENTALILSPASLLANDSDVDGNTLFIMGLGDPVNGSVELESDGNIRFTPNPDFTGIGSFTYMVGDGNGGGATATVTVTVQPEVTDPGDPGNPGDPGTPDDITGTDGNDTLVGTPKRDRLKALAGDDLVAGLMDDDFISGGDGNDILRGDLNGDEPGSTVGGNDTIFGGAGSDRIGGKSGNDLLFGDEGDDSIWGDDGNDTLRGGAGSDRLTGDDFSGGQGADLFILAPGEGTDTITDFEVGTDVLGLASGLTFDALTITQQGSNTRITASGATLAVLEGITATLDSSSFTAI